MQVTDLLNQKKITQRAYNLCLYNHIFTLEDLIKYFISNRNFNSLRNCGVKSNDELIVICKYYLEFDEYKQLIICNANNQTLIESNGTFEVNLNRLQREVVNVFIEININQLTNRSRNAIVLHLDKNLKIKNFIDNNFFSLSFDAKNMRNIGLKCIPEINNFVSNVKDFAFEVSKTEDENQLIKLKNSYLLHRTFSISNMSNEIIEKQSIFRLTDFLFNKYYLLKERDTLILKECLYLFSDVEIKDLNEIADKFNITRQRVEGIRKEGVTLFYEKLLFIKNFTDASLLNYKIDENLSIIELSDDIVLRINNDNGTNFTKQFITFIIYVYFSEKLTLVGNIEDVFQKNYFNNRTRHNWTNFYLVNNEISNEFNFYAFANDVDKRRNEKREETYEFNFKSYLSKFLTNQNLDKLDDIFDVAEKILNNEFNIYLDIDNNIVFERNTNKQVYEYAIDILEEIGEPTKIDKIYQLLEQKDPGITKSADALRGSLQRNPEIIFFGRFSTYGLRKWESEKENIKGGSIKDLVLNYLDKNNTPIHINQILSEVKKFGYDTNAKNIITNLKLDPYKQFIVFNQSFIGLKSKNYDTNLTTLPKFLGKSITYYVKTNQNIRKQKVVEYFVNQLAISTLDMNYIIEYLIDNQFIKTTNQNELTI
ncbi:MAG: hypothetical protein KA210_01030 [Bacteroidia bacterium]|nr:hypothetical protein [Bacteroidia bacterium]